MAAAFLAAGCGLAGAASAHGRAGGAIAYAHLVPGGAEIVVVAPDGRDPVVVAHGRDPDWSPDGARLAYSRGGAIYVAGADGGAEVRVTRGADPSWSPDGRRLAFADAGGVWVFDFDGGSRRRLVTGGEPAWSSRDEIAFAAAGDLFAVRPDGTGRRPLTTGADYDRAPAWAPNGRDRAFVRVAAHPLFHHPYVVVMRADGSTAGPGGGTGVAWSPDGTKLVAADEGDLCIRLGEREARLTHRRDAAANVEPAWQPGEAAAVPPASQDHGEPPACGDREPELSMQIGADHDPGGPRKVIAYTFFVQAGTAPLQNVWVVGDVDGALAPVRLSATAGSCALLSEAHRLECHVAALAPRQTAIFTFRFRPLERLPAIHTALYLDGDFSTEEQGPSYDADFESCSIGGTEADDRILGTPGHDEICGFGGDDVITGGGGTDWIDGGPGADRLEGGVRADRLYGGAGNDSLAGDAGRDYLSGGPGADTLYARDGGPDYVYGDAGRDRARVDRGIVDTVWSIEAVF